MFRLVDSNTTELDTGLAHHEEVSVPSKSLHTSPGTEHIFKLLDELKYRTNYLDTSVVAEDVILMHLKLNEISRNVRRCHNERTPIARLATEILCYIFRLIVDVQPTALDVLPQVCKRWRTTAISHAVLWSNISASYGQPNTLHRAITFLSRSKSAAISVDLVTSTDDFSNDNLMTELLAQLARKGNNLKNYTLSVVAGDPFLCLSKLTRFPAPNLEMLTILAAEYEDLDDFPQVFCGSLPNLKYLKLDGFTEWPPNLFKNLSRIELNTRDSPFMLLLSRFFDLLRNSPMLKVLSLTNDGPSEQKMTPHSPVKLAHLEQLYIGEFDANLILPLLLLPKSTQVIINNSSYFGEPHSILLRILEETYPLLDNIESLHFILRIGQVEVLFANPDDGYLKVIKGGFPQSEYRGYPEMSFDRISTSFRFDSVRSVSFINEAWHDISSVGFQIPVSSLARWFVRLESLRDLEVRMRPMGNRNVFEALMPGPSDGIHPCPNLQRFRVIVDCFEHIEGDGYMHELMRLLESRSERGCRIQTLALEVYGNWDSECSKEAWKDRLQMFSDEAIVEFHEECLTYDI